MTRLAMPDNREVELKFQVPASSRAALLAELAGGRLSAERTTREFLADAAEQNVRERDRRGPTQPHDFVLDEVDGTLDFLRTRRVVPEVLPGVSGRADVKSMHGLGAAALSAHHNDMFRANVKQRGDLRSSRPSDANNCREVRFELDAGALV